MPPIKPPKPQIVSLGDGGAIIAWLGTYPAGTTFSTYWEAGTIASPPALPFANQFEASIKSRTNSIRVGSGLNAIPSGTNVYVSVTSSIHGLESNQSDPIFLSICNGDNSDSVNVAKDDSDSKKLLRTDEKGNLFVVSDADAPFVVDEKSLLGNEPEIISVSNTSAPLPFSPLAGRRLLVIQNQHSTNLYVGLSGSELFLIPGNQSLTFTVGESTKIYGKRVVGSGNVCVWEFS